MVLLYSFKVYSIDSPKIIGNFPEVLNLDRLFLKLNWFICNKPPVLPEPCYKPRLGRNPGGCYRLCFQHNKKGQGARLTIHLMQSYFFKMTHLENKKTIVLPSAT